MSSPALVANLNLLQRRAALSTATYQASGKQQDLIAALETQNQIIAILIGLLVPK